MRQTDHATPDLLLSCIIHTESTIILNLTWIKSTKHIREQIRLTYIVALHMKPSEGYLWWHTDVTTTHCEFHV